jgi:hypothetical protein
MLLTREEEQADGSLGDPESDDVRRPVAVHVGDLPEVEVRIPAAGSPELGAPLRGRQEPVASREGDEDAGAPSAEGGQEETSPGVPFHRHRSFPAVPWEGRPRNLAGRPDLPSGKKKGAR